MRARLALNVSGIAVELREVVLCNKPKSLLSASPKGSVPVLVLPDGYVIDESWDIMLWALHQHDPEGWMGENAAYVNIAAPLIIKNDTVFKYNLDRYKYPDRNPEHSQIFYRTQAETFLQELETRLNMSPYLLGVNMSIADAGILPFIRQFASVDKEWFAQSRYPLLNEWLQRFLASERFNAIMKKQPLWQEMDTNTTRE